MPIVRPRAMRSCVQKPTGNCCERRGGGGMAADSPDFWASGGAKFTKMGDSLPWTPKNRNATAKFDTTSFSLGGEIRNSTQTQIHKQIHKHNSN